MESTDSFLAWCSGTSMRKKMLKLRHQRPFFLWTHGTFMSVPLYFSIFEFLSSLRYGSVTYLSLVWRLKSARVVHVNSVLIARVSAMIGYYKKALYIHFHSILVWIEFLSNETPNLSFCSERMARLRLFYFVYFAIFTPYFITFLYTLCKV